jgi:DNA repair photolyase
MEGMRWEQQRADHLAEQALPLGLPDPAAQRRGSGRAGLQLAPTGPVIAGTDDAMAIEIQAKSLINRVPGESAMPFRWTINPYRGCTHACVYCLDGATQVLLADGRSRPIAELQVGDEIYGTRRDGAYRRYVPTQVLAHWRTVKRAYRVSLADGTTIVASGDHRFLTERGWKHVRGAMNGAARRPYLTTNNTLMGIGSLPAPATAGPDYRRGYLSGIVRGDGTLGTYTYPYGTVHRFRLALADGQALDRARSYLDGFGVVTRSFPFRTAGWQRRDMTAIASSRRDDVARTQQLIAYPAATTAEWDRGFLAGVFDAEGSHSQGIFRIANTDPELIGRASAALRRFDFDPVVERRDRADGLQYVRLRGGLPQRMRFFALTDPAIDRKRALSGTAVKCAADLRVVSIEDLGEEREMYDITTGTGDFVANGVISHNCFARNTHTYLDLDAGHDFDSKIIVKVNAGPLLRRELASPRWCGEPIAMGTNVDPYQRVEGRYRLMREILGALRDHANPFSILTKGTLIQRDQDLLTQAAAVTDVSVAFSIGFLDEALWRLVEPGTPAPSRRLDLVRRFTDAGIGCSVLMAPILPGLTDQEAELDRTVAALVDAGVTSITPIVLHLRPGAREWYQAFLERHFPRLVQPYRRLYRNGSYAPAAYQRTVVARVRSACRRHGLPDRSAENFRDVGEAAPGPPPAGRPAEQLRLV